MATYAGLPRTQLLESIYLDHNSLNSLIERKLEDRTGITTYGATIRMRLFRDWQGDWTGVAGRLVTRFPTYRFHRYRLERQLPARGAHPLGDGAFPQRTEIYGLASRQFWMRFLQTFGVLMDDDFGIGVGFHDRQFYFVGDIVGSHQGHIRTQHQVKLDEGVSA